MNHEPPDQRPFPPSSNDPPTMSPPRIMFDDGSRIMQEAKNDANSFGLLLPNDDSAPSPQKSLSSSCARKKNSVPIHVYYEIERVANEVVDRLDWSTNTCRGRLLRQIISSSGRIMDHDDNDDYDDDVVENDGTTHDVMHISHDDDGFLCRIALQFPDDLLTDAPEVSWLMEEAIILAYRKKLLLHNSTTSISIMQDDDSTTHSLIEQHVAQQPPLVFILGDSSPSCCPDEVSANHLNANVIVHYGYACLSPSESVPVVYAFGVSQTSTTTNTISSATDNDDTNDHSVWETCAQMIINVNQDEEEFTARERKLLVVYDVIYHHAMDDLKLEFDKVGQNQTVFSLIPKQQLSVTRRLDNRKGGGSCDSGPCYGGKGRSFDSNNSSSQCAHSSECCGGAPRDSSSCCAEAAHLTGGALDSEPNCVADRIHQPHPDKQYIPRTIGGLEIPEELDLSQYTLLYIGDDLNIDLHDGNAQHRLLQILLRCNSPDGPRSIWSYSPVHRHLNTDVLNSPLSSSNCTTLSSILARMLRRRYFLLNKAKLATTIAILIGTTSNSYSFRRLLSRTRDRIQLTGRTAYTFAVGKLSTSGHKLANFAEIDCFVLISCGESITQFWQMERDDMIVPVLSPAELDVALGFREWDGRYSCDFGDWIRWDETDARRNDAQPRNMKDKETNDDDEPTNEGSSDDEPFFSMISGKYEQPKAMASMTTIDLGALPGQGILTEYRSEAAEFLNKREYRGLEAKVGETKVQVAVLGKVGIASDYGETV